MSPPGTKVMEPLPELYAIFQGEVCEHSAGNRRTMRLCSSSLLSLGRCPCTSMCVCSHVYISLYKELVRVAQEQLTPSALVSRQCWL